MKISKYISLNLFSIVSYFFILIFFCIFFKDNNIFHIIKIPYLILEQLCAIYSFVIFCLIIALGLFFIEIYIRKTQPKKIRKIHFKNKLKKFYHSLFFYIGFYLGIINLIIYILFIILLNIFS
ncbi:MAG: hypothetical protein E7Z87_01710 [Cyanobacteria bacterium SIG26]|nr:hypothetical protein [Cyanobacteria bacterium SIG26]